MVEKQEVMGRVPDCTGLSSPAEPQERLGPSGFDPSREQRLECLKLAHKWSELRRAGGYSGIDVQDTLDMADRYYRYVRGDDPRDVIDLEPLWMRDRDRDRSGEADETAKQAQPEARARAEGIAQTPSGDPT